MLISAIRRSGINLAALVALTAASAACGQDSASPAEQEFIAVLQSDAQEADKAIACKRLAVYGSEAAVPELAKLLSNEHLASWARIALEAIPGDSSNEALRSAAGSLDGLLLVGVVNSIGVRRDAGSVELLSGLTANGDPLIASCAAVALGRIGNETATSKLRELLAAAPEAVRSAVAEACVLCAEHALADGRTAEAIEIYDQVRAAEVPIQRRLEATRGAILARGNDGIPLLVEQLHSGEKKYFEIALTAARELPGSAIDNALATELPNIAPFRAPALIATMADRPQTVVLAAIQDAAASGPTPTRLAGITALGRVGNATCLDGLLEIAGGSDAELSPAAKAALAVLPGNSVDADIVARVGQAKGGQYIALLELIGARRIAALDPLLKALDHSDNAVRAAALASLGRTVPADKLSILIAQATAPKHADDAEAAQAALMTAAVRMPDREACAAEVAAALNGSPVPTQVALLEVVAAVKATKSLETLHDVALQGDVQVRDASTRLLGGWLTVDAAPVLLDLAKTGPADQYRVRSLRGYLRIARQFVKDKGEQLAMLKNALEAEARPAEQKLVLEILALNPSVDGLRLAVDLRQQPQLKDDALRSILTIAQKTDGSTDDVLALLRNADLPKMKVDIIKAEYGAPGALKDVTDIVKQRVTDSPVLVLEPAAYNSAFGGDPAPNQSKQLRIEYRIDGKPTDIVPEVRFPEDHVIVLPLPK